MKVRTRVKQIPPKEPEWFENGFPPLPNEYVINDEEEDSSGRTSGIYH